MKSDNIRIRLLAVLDILENQSDKNHPWSAADILEELAKRDITAERKAIYSDVEALNCSGYNIVRTGSPKRGYYMAERDFQIPEICLLIDAVQSAGFISKKNTEILVNKLEGLISKGESEQIKGRVCIENRSKSGNGMIYKIIDTVNKAIIDKRKVSIKYTSKFLKGTSIETSYKDMSISPYALLWESDHYYLIGNYTKYDNLIHLRLDRISEINILEKEPARHFSEICEYKQRFDVADYAKKTFNMFGGELCRIDFECSIEILQQIIDRFGSNIFIRHFDNEDSFRFSTDANISEGLIGWIMQFGGKIRVLSPKTLKEVIKERAESLAKIMEQ